VRLLLVFIFFDMFFYLLWRIIPQADKIRCTAVKMWCFFLSLSGPIDNIHRYCVVPVEHLAGRPSLHENTSVPRRRTFVARLYSVDSITGPHTSCCTVYAESQSFSDCFGKYGPINNHSFTVAFGNEYRRKHVIHNTRTIHRLASCHLKPVAPLLCEI